MTPDMYFDGFVLGNFHDFVDHKESVRHAFNAALAASHMADHYFKYCQRYHRSKVNRFPRLREFIKHHTQKTGGAFGDVRSIANAFKHLYIDTDQYSSISSTGAIEAIVIHGPSIQEVFENLHDDEAVVFYTTKNGERREFLPTLKAVIELWEQLIPGLSNRNDMAVQPSDSNLHKEGSQ